MNIRPRHRDVKQGDTVRLYMSGYTVPQGTVGRVTKVLERDKGLTAALQVQWSTGQTSVPVWPHHVRVLDNVRLLRV